MLEKPAAITPQAPPIETAHTDEHQAEDASMPLLKTLSLFTVHEHVKGSQGACKATLAACWRKANAIAGDEWAIKRTPVFTEQQRLDWSDAVRASDVGKGTEAKLRMQRKRNPVEAQAVGNRRRQEQFKFSALLGWCTSSTLARMVARGCL